MNDRNVERQLWLELRHIARVIHTFIEAAAELRSDGLDRDTFIGDLKFGAPDLGLLQRCCGLGAVPESSR
jgi:hypothetical protein